MINFKFAEKLQKAYDKMEAENKEPDPERVKVAKRIVNNPAIWKVCCGCDSIVHQRVNICPNCHAYKFNGDPKFVCEKAQELSTRDQNSVTEGDME